MGRGSEDRVAVLDFESAVREPSDIAASGLFVEVCLEVFVGVWWFQAPLVGCRPEEISRSEIGLVCLRYGPAILNTAQEGGCPY